MLAQPILIYSKKYNSNCLINCFNNIRGILFTYFVNIQHEGKIILILLFI